MQHSGWRPAIHRFKVRAALLAGVLLVTAVIGTLLAQFQGTLQGTATEVVLYAFKGPSHGTNPRAGVVRDSAGNLYGTASNGGAAGQGVVFRVDPTGHETVLHSFTGGSDGGNPGAGVIGDSAGNLYGTTIHGGPANAGIVYKLDAAGHETALHSFTGGSDGGNPQAGVIRDSAGNLYGTTPNGGIATCAPFGCGVVFKLDATGHETVLYSFTGGSDGGNPSGGVIRDSAGNLYGTASNGGIPTGGCAPYGCGVVFKLDATGHETVYSFTGGADGYGPEAGVIGDSAGNLYGTTISGGPSNLGVVYKLDATGRETVLYGFTGGPDGGVPQAGLIRDSAGNLYGTTFSGGIVCPGGCGVVYKVELTGHYTVLYSFTRGADGAFPNAGVIGDGAGNLYGTTIQGGLADLGVVYKLDPTGHETVLYSFSSAGADGMNPISGVIGDGVGNLYGTTYNGGTTTPPRGLGVVFKLDTAGQETVLHTFTGGADGYGPQAGVIRDSAGNLYGTTIHGGAGGQGVVFRVDPTGNEMVLHTFTGRADGGNPVAGVVRDRAGNLYGTTQQGGITTGFCGSGGCGVMYKLDATGHETVLYSFTGGVPDGGGPQGGVIGDSAGNLYGTTVSGTIYCLPLQGCTFFGGSVFKVDPTGHMTVLYSFTGGADGANSYGSLIRDSAGNLYGTTGNGGITGTGACAHGVYGCGVVFKLDSAGHETVLYSFTGGPDGGSPQAGLIRDSAGNLYGTTAAGGITTGVCQPYGGCGVVFKLDTAGQETVLHTFTGGSDGGNPSSSVIRDSAGNLYGTTAYGGPANAGVVYKIKP